jgi:hypothetical protein
LRPGGGRISAKDFLPPSAAVSRSQNPAILEQLKEVK